MPAIEALARDAPRLRCELVEAEPEQALPALALGDLDIVLGDEWQHQPWHLPAGRGATRCSAIRSTSCCRFVTDSLGLVARGLAITMLPELVLAGRHPGTTTRPIVGAPVARTVYAVTRATDARRPSTQALVAAVRNVAAALTSGPRPPRPGAAVQARGLSGHGGR